ncbi:MAG TPA: hypothetical protein HPP58_00270 [Deltaproteobacteria bacterium]|nr:hypothetical protein [Deltaproteobacteria bacterium]HIJ40811.1 hypothetical protein [Deltaproteobacteria bacterium]
MVWFSIYPGLEFSLILGSLIAESLPTVQARPWKKAMLPWQAYGGISAIKKKALRIVPDAAWPIESVLFCYPGKKAYGEGEPIFLEMKLIGESADHAHFLEVILPALEKSGSSIDRTRQTPNALWGKFDIQSIFAARGPVWEPFVENGRLDLHYKPTPSQWSEGLDFHSNARRPLRLLKWITPFDLAPHETVEDKRKSSNRITLDEVPSLRDILGAFMARMNGLSTGKRGASTRFWDILDEADRQAFEAATAAASRVQMKHGSFQRVSGLRPGRWFGRQEFSPIPEIVRPYLGLASIFHIGAHTHFGCGTFVLF